MFVQCCPVQFSPEACCKSTVQKRYDEPPNAEEDDIKRLVADPPSASGRSRSARSAPPVASPDSDDGEARSVSKGSDSYNFAEVCEQDDFECKVDDRDPLYQELIGPDGVYTGQVHPRTGKYHGNGVFRSPEAVLEGSWQDGLLHGRARQVWQDGRRYVGEFAQGKFSGKGRMEWPHPTQPMVYEGYYLDDRKHGEGTFLWPSGKRYQGQWEHGRRHGLGVDISPTGVKMAGHWQDNVLVTPASEKDASGQ